jgi:hypothetical protein
MLRLAATAFWKGTDPYLLARIYKATAAYAEQAIAQSDVSTITYEVFNKSSGASLATGSLTVSDVVLNALSTGNIWTVDSTGFNFVWIASRSLFTASVTHRIAVTITLTSGKVVVVTFELKAANPAGD